MLADSAKVAELVQLLVRVRGVALGSTAATLTTSLDATIASVVENFLAHDGVDHRDESPSST